MKKILHYIAPRFLAAGASLTMGLLSFGGTLALVSSLPLAIAGFVLSTVYEGEIYLQNIKRALKKLFKLNHLERQVARDYLLDQVERDLAPDAPDFFKDYKAALQSRHPNKKKLSDMEKWFALQLFAAPQNPSAYQANLQAWLRQQRKHIQQETVWEETRRLRQASIRFVPAFCMLAGVFMGLGTTYLLMDAFLAIPMLAALPAAAVPALIVPMALIAGAAYGFLIYNATTDMITHDTVGTWFKDIKTDWANGQYGMAAVFVFMFVLSVALSLCTAGTWWTVAKTTPPVFDWMRKMPSWIMLKINPLISSISTLIFNAQNISETLDMVKQSMNEGEADADAPSAAPAVRDENAWQRNNPFQFVIRLTFEPLRSVLFLGHLTSVSAVADRVPGVSAWISALLGFVNEMFEDAHYFFGGAQHQHKRDLPSLIADRRDAGQGHDHADDLPTQLLRIVFHVLYVPAALWDWGCSDARQNLDFWAALERQRGMQKNEASCNGCLPRGGQSQSSVHSPWEFEQAIYRIERHKEKDLDDEWMGQDVVAEQRAALTILQADLRTAEEELRKLPPVHLRLAKYCLPCRPTVHSVISEHIYEHREVYNRQRFFGPDTCAVLNQLPSRVSSMASAA
ncbi:MAG TPA: hypothetical protein DDY37_08175 [Legionella sp.]|nr:hypothetical protein [Legionella sp.]